MRILVVDNYDSFVFNLVQYLGQLGPGTVGPDDSSGVEVEVWRNDDDRLTVPDDELIATLREFDGVLLSPGPSTPANAGELLRIAGIAQREGIATLGVCLGHQALGEAAGAVVERAPELMHGKTSAVAHHGEGVLAGLPDPFTATRYHSLTIRPGTLPAEWIVTGQTDTGIIMAMRHRDLPLHGVQFHPESVLTEGGHRMLANWLTAAGATVNENLVARLEAEVAAAISTV